jgi:hypothetical protein
MTMIFKVTLDTVSPMEGQNVRLPENVPWMNLKKVEALQDLLADRSRWQVRIRRGVRRVLRPGLGAPCETRSRASAQPAAQAAGVIGWGPVPAACAPRREPALVLASLDSSSKLRRDEPFRVARRRRPGRAAKARPGVSVWA